MNAAPLYVGRFAPSPTGPLHFGSLLAAVASYLEARRNRGRWLVRIEDIDPPREQPGASESIIASLERYGFAWDGDVAFQSRSDGPHRRELQRLLDAGLAYRCGCSRRDLAGLPHSSLGIIYPGTCRNGTSAAETAIRIRTDDTVIGFEDGLQGLQTTRLESQSGDFVIRRRDGLIAYHLAVVVDDYLQGVTHIVRGIDLMDSTPRQIWLQRLLRYAVPNYAHIPVAVHADGNKLSKLTGAPGLPLEPAGAILVMALAALGQEPPDDLAAAPVDAVWAWALEHWDIQVLRGQDAVYVDKSTSWACPDGVTRRPKR